LPVFLPIFLIAAKSLIGLWPGAGPAELRALLTFLGEPVAALALGILLALPLFRYGNQQNLSPLLEAGIEKTGPILAIIAVGGAFGEVIKTLDLGRVYGPMLVQSGAGLWIPFLFTVLFKTAQGSSTVAVMSAAAILKSLLPSLGLATPDEQLWALMAMGAGSMGVSHANDAYFWVISRFGQLPTNLALRYYSLATAGMSLVSLGMIFLLKNIF
jgi:GntP family gluconate:H+ symporter